LEKKVNNYCFIKVLLQLIFEDKIHNNAEQSHCKRNKNNKFDLKNKK